MKTLTLLVALLLLSVSLIAQDAPIPQDIPLQRPKLLPELMNPGVQAARPPVRWLQNGVVAPKRIVATDSRANPSIEDRIAALEAKIAAMQSEIEAQRALIRQLEERLEQQKKN
jgi:TolA-binding protein